MRRPGQWFLNFVTTLSLLLCFVAVVMWVRSYSTAEIYEVDDGTGYQFEATIQQGCIVVIYSGKAFAPAVPASGVEGNWSRRPVTPLYAYDEFVQRTDPVHRMLFGAHFFWMDDYAFDERGPETYAMVPIWWLLAVAALLPARRWRTFHIARRSRHAAPSQCRKCAYDLTANTGGVCPECGTKVAEQAVPRV